VISNKKKFVDYLDELGLFIEENPIFTKKKFRRSAVCCLARFHGCPNKNFLCTIFERCFQVSSPFRSLKELV
jgi:hypothetical protein